MPLALPFKRHEISTVLKLNYRFNNNDNVFYWQVTNARELTFLNFRGALGVNDMISEVVFRENCIWSSQQIIQNNLGHNRSLLSGCPPLSISIKKSSG